MKKQKICIPANGIIRFVRFNLNEILLGISFMYLTKIIDDDIGKNQNKMLIKPFLGVK